MRYYWFSYYTYLWSYMFFQIYSHLCYRTFHLKVSIIWGVGLSNELEVVCPIWLALITLILQFWLVAWIEIELFQLDEAYEASARAIARISALENQLTKITNEAMATEALCSYLGKFSEKALSPPPVKWSSMYFWFRKRIFCEMQNKSWLALKSGLNN